MANSTPSSEMDYLYVLLELVQDKDWDTFEAIAIPNPKTFRCISEFISESVDFNGMTLLHACARYGPPVRLLDRMIMLYPQAIQKQDCIGRTPLHVAAGCGASPSVVTLLTIHYREACAVQDEDGRTPLHLACDSSCELFDEDTDAEPRSPPNIDVVRALLKGSLESVTLDDADEVTAVEYAIMSDAPMEVVTLLQHATKRVMTTSKPSGVDLPHQNHEQSAMMITLLKGSLESVTLDDADEVTAVEYDIMSDAPMEFVTLLQHATKRVMTTSKPSGVDLPHQNHEQSAMMIM